MRQGIYCFQRIYKGGGSMETFKSNVYIKTDEKGRILRCEGGYTMGNITDTAEWILIDEGMGDRYNLCQSYYFDRLYTEDSIPRYKWDGERAALRTAEEIAADRAALPAPPPSTEERLGTLESATDEMVLLLAEMIGG